MSDRDNAESMPSMLPTEEQNALRSSVRELLADHAPLVRTLERLESAEVADPTLWRRLAVGLGATGLAVSESFGGAGASWVETAVVAEELGRVAAPVPFLGSAVLATAALLTVDAQEVLTRLATGERSATLVVPFAAALPDGLPEIAVEGDALSGVVEDVIDAEVVDDYLVPAGGRLYLVAAVDARCEPVTSLDATRPVARVHFASTQARCLASGPQALAALRAAALAGGAMLAAEQLGIASSALEATVDYLKVRHQFGRALGSYQALKHRLADQWVSLTQARAVVRYAAARLSEGHPDAGVAVALAQAFCSPLAVHAVEEMVQLHGGIGFTWELPAHVLLKRAKSAAIGLGGADRHRAWLGELVDLRM
ncbi:MAG: acyl-CoA dehydrogenase family protein [Sciscionella sp.]